MKHITTDLSIGNSPTSEKRQDSTRPEKVWVQLAEMFGNHFLREHGDEPTTLWKNAVYRLTDEQIASGLANLGNEGLTYPPNLSQFVAACKLPQVKPPYWNAPKIEDQRKPGRMPFAEWKRLNGID